MLIYISGKIQVVLFEDKKKKKNGKVPTLN